MKKEIKFIKSIENYLEIEKIKINLKDGYFGIPISKANVSKFQKITDEYFDDSSSLFFNVFNIINNHSFLIKVEFEFKKGLITNKVFLEVEENNKNISFNLIESLCDWFQKIFFAENIYYEGKKIHFNKNFKENEILTAGPSIGVREIIYSSDAVKNGWNNKWNRYLKKFEDDFAKYIGVKYAIATSSCTGAMEISLMALNIGKEDEVIVPDITWVSSANVVHAVGATPIFADVNHDTWTIDPKSIESKITNKTKGIIAVHMYGHPAEMDKIIELSKKYNLKIIEDAAPSIGAEFKGQKTGSFGDFSAFSFQGAKLLVTGEGGMLCTNNKELYDRAYRIWDQGRIPGTFWIEEYGPKYKMSNIQAAFGLGQLERIDSMVEKKRQINKWYHERLKNINHIVFWKESTEVKSICWMTSILLKEESKISREKFCQKLKKRNIDTRPVFPSISQYPYWNTKQKQQTNSALIAESGINLPSGVCLTKEEVDYVCDCIIEILNNDN